jgi:hypothetical protein
LLEVVGLAIASGEETEEVLVEESVESALDLRRRKEVKGGGKSGKSTVGKDDYGGMTWWYLITIRER